MVGYKTAATMVVQFSLKSELKTNFNHEYKLAVNTLLYAVYQKTHGKKISLPSYLKGG